MDNFYIFINCYTLNGNDRIITLQVTAYYPVNQKSLHLFL